MQHLDPTTLRPRPAPRRDIALAGLALAMLAAAAPAAAGEPIPPADRAAPSVFMAGEGDLGMRTRPEVWPIAVDLDLGEGERGLDLPPVGLAVRLSEGASLGAAGGLDLSGDEMVGIIALKFDF